MRRPGAAADMRSLLAPADSGAPLRHGPTSRRAASSAGSGRRGDGALPAPAGPRRLLRRLRTEPGGAGGGVAADARRAAPRRGRGEPGLRRFREPSLFRRACVREVADLLAEAKAVSKARPGLALRLLQRCAALQPEEPDHLLGLAALLRRLNAPGRGRGGAGPCRRPRLRAPLARGAGGPRRGRPRLGRRRHPDRRRGAGAGARAPPRSRSGASGGGEARGPRQPRHRLRRPGVLRHPSDELRLHLLERARRRAPGERHGRLPPGPTPADAGASGRGGGGVREGGGRPAARRGRSRGLEAAHRRGLPGRGLRGGPGQSRPHARSGDAVAWRGDRMAGAVRLRGTGVQRSPGAAGPFR